MRNLIISKQELLEILNECRVPHPKRKAIMKAVYHKEEEKGAKGPNGIGALIRETLANKKMTTIEISDLLEIPRKRCYSALRREVAAGNATRHKLVHNPRGADIMMWALTPQGRKQVKLDIEKGKGK